MTLAPARLRRRRRALALLRSPAAAATSGDERPSGPGGARASPPPDLPMPRRSATGEGEVNILAWAGYAENGSTDPKVDWVTPFEKETGCKVNVKIVGTSDEMVTLMKTGDYDVVSASGDASLRLIAAGDVAPVNTDLVANYKDIFDVPQGPSRGTPSTASDVRRPARLRRQPADVPHRHRQAGPDSWGAVFDADSPYKGKVTAYDSPIYIADAALYLMKHQARPGHQEPVRAGRQAVRRGRRPAQAAERATSASTGRTTPRRSRRSRPATP